MVFDGSTDENVQADIPEAKLSKAITKFHPPSKLRQYETSGPSMTPPIDAIPLTMLVTFTPAAWPLSLPNLRVVAPLITESGPQLQNPMVNKIKEIPKRGIR